MIMIYVTYENTKEAKAKVTGQFYNEATFDQLPKENGLKVEQVPSPEYKIGKDAILHYNKETEELYYEYVDRPLTTEEEIVKLKEAMAELAEMVASN